MKDYITIAGHLNVSHLMMLSQTEKNVLMRIARSPTGPTLHFRVNHFMLASQIKAMQKRPFDSAAACKCNIACFLHQCSHLLFDCPFF
jgi:ribosome biogenesis protein SSF1/2